jgi:hypothetical protein
MITCMKELIVFLSLTLQEQVICEKHDQDFALL